MKQLAWPTPASPLAPPPSPLTPFSHAQQKTAAERLPVSVQMIERRIYLIRAQKVMLDSDLAELYRVSTRALNQAVSTVSPRISCSSSPGTSSTIGDHKL